MSVATTGQVVVTEPRRVARRPAFLMATALVVLAAWELAVVVRSGASAPADDDWRSAAAEVERSWRPDDLIVFAPEWIDPVGRKWLGARISVEQAARMDAERYGRIWELSIRGARALETARLPSPAYQRDFGAVRVRRFDRSARIVAWDTLARSRLVEVDFQPRLCVPIAPSPRGSPPARLDFGLVPLGDTLRVFAGLADFRTRRENRSRALVTVRVGGVQVATATVGNDSGWVQLSDIATARGRGEVVVEATVDPARGSATAATLNLCVAAEALQ